MHYAGRLPKSGDETNVGQMPCPHVGHATRVTIGSGLPDTRKPEEEVEAATRKISAPAAEFTKAASKD